MDMFSGYRKGLGDYTHRDIDADQLSIEMGFISDAGIIAQIIEETKWKRRWRELLPKAMSDFGLDREPTNKKVIRYLKDSYIV